ncbi:Wadjet anti-phage system protein JetD domain-containing protein [Youngiibacter multivorans]|uniref:Wadjet protein JetD C-terminal domain-containing protein n=1 Tax=Youngiibacter multivorans TaxID=937251 RepID=A0ABS4FZR5_9CLOT|nr:Wadjet anti-phage system protein JetD domain-containing protein [Youngiibacter multivorans]MBP1917706.1 hypothetical protein [Youngiibacter multivorans]
MKSRTYIEKYQKKTIELSDIILNSSESYEEVADTLRILVAENSLAPVKASGLNGRRPALFNRYKMIVKKKDYAEALVSIKMLHPKFDHQYYLDHPDLYLALEEEIEALSSFLWKRPEELLHPMSVNERSFSIFGKEKLLRSIERQFATYFKLQNFSFMDLNTYPTPEPFFEYIHPKTENGEILIIENKDTWYTLRKIMKEDNLSVLFGIPFKVLLYGEGKKITRQSGRLMEYQEEVLKEKRHTFYYFGDLDYEGIFIYQDAKDKNPEVDIRLFTDAYETMMTEVLHREYPETRDHRNPRADLETFLSNFSEASQEKIIGILEKGLYIPQEVLNYKILKSKMKGIEHV